MFCGTVKKGGARYAPLAASGFYNLRETKPAVVLIHRRNTVQVPIKYGRFTERRTIGKSGFVGVRGLLK